MSTRKCPYCEWPLDRVDGDVEHACDPHEMFIRGAAAIVGLLDMAKAIRNRYVACPLCHDVGAYPMGIYWECGRCKHNFQPGNGPWM